MNPYALDLARLVCSHSHARIPYPYHSLHPPPAPALLACGPSPHALLRGSVYAYGVSGDRRHEPIHDGRW
eukprot:scaffold45467_cov27-Tisochrysis_lutea.AAC.1